jgi:magnesium transporter
MLIIYKTTEQGLEQIESMANGAWIKVIDPTPEEIEKLLNWGIDVDYINYSLDFDEMPRMERDDDFTFILLRIPHSQPENDIPYITIPLGIMIRNNVIVTICRYDKEMFKVLANGKYRLLKTAKRYRFALYIFLETATRYLTHLREINRMTETIEDQLQKSTRNREVLELLKYQKSLTYFATALRSNEVMMERVQRTQLFNYYEEDQDLLEDVLTENQQAIQMTSINADHFQQPERRNEGPGCDHDRGQRAWHGRRLLRDERCPAGQRAGTCLPDGVRDRRGAGRHRSLYLL